jgi:hypothetical protein
MVLRDGEVVGFVQEVFHDVFYAGTSDPTRYRTLEAALATFQGG